MRTMSSVQVLSDLCVCFEKSIDRGRAVKDTRGEWYAKVV